MTGESVITPEQAPFDDFSPKKFILTSRKAAGYLGSRWRPILLAALLAGLGGFLYSFLKHPKYVAEMTFALDEGAAQTTNPAAVPLTEQIILGSSLEAGGIFSSMTNIVELMQSRLLIERTLRTGLNENGKMMSYADLFLDSLDYREKWFKGKKNTHPSFLIVSAVKDDSLAVNATLYNIFQILTKKVIKIDQKGKGTTIISVTCLSENETFSKRFLEAWMNEVTRFYIDTKTQRAKISLAFVQKRTDSVRNAYNTALYGRAAFSDALVNPIRQTASISAEKQQTDIQILRASYIELERSLEMAKTTLLRDTPLIQYIDLPILPLKQLKSDLLKITLLAFFGGAFLMSGYLAFRKGADIIMA